MEIRCDCGSVGTLGVEFVRSEGSDSKPITVKRRRDTYFYWVNEETSDRAVEPVTQWDSLMKFRYCPWCIEARMATELPIVASVSVSTVVSEQ